MKDKIKTVIEMVLKEADGLEMDAGYSGAHHDGGAGHLRQLVKFYTYGAEGVFPPEWNSYIVKLDAEYPDYLRLKKKFEGR